MTVTPKQRLLALIMLAPEEDLAEIIATAFHQSTAGYDDLLKAVVKQLNTMDENEATDLQITLEDFK